MSSTPNRPTSSSAAGRPAKLRAWVKKLSKRQLAVIGVVAAFAVLGIVAIRLSGAATFAVAVEAENGNLSGKAASVAGQAGASGSVVNFGSGTGGGGGTGATYPLKVGPTNRYLIGQNSQPVLVNADTAWMLSSTLTKADAANYLETRKNQGFNTILTSIADIGRDEILNTKTREGVKLFNGSIASPNDAYFNHIDYLLDEADKRGMQLALWTLWLQAAANSNSGFNTTNAASYGKYLAERLGSKHDNIIWIMGGDWGGPTEGTCPKQAEVRAMANAIKANDPKHHLISYHPGLNLSSSMCYHGDDWLSFNGTYWAYDEYVFHQESYYKNIHRDYKMAPAKPTMMLETHYEGNGNGPIGKIAPIQIRQQVHYQMLAGGLGWTYGGFTSYGRFENGGYLDRGGAFQQGYAAEMFRKRAWYKLAPDLDNSLITAGNSAYGSDTLAVGAADPAGSLAIIYTPNSKNLTVNLAKLSGTVSARWYDPTKSNTWQPVGGAPFANTGSRQFQTPGNNGAGQQDWVLVLETSPPAN